MSIAIRCEHCGHEYHVNSSLRGKRVRCKQCSKPIRVVAMPPRAGGAGGSSTLKKRSPMRHVYRAIALIVIGMFGFTIYLLGRNMGYWGEAPRPGMAHKAKKLSPAEQLQQDRVTSQERLAQLGQALRLWAGEHRGNYPPRLLDVYEVADLHSQTVLSPFGGQREKDFAYLYFRSMGTSMPPQTVVAYDAAALAKGGGTAVLFAGGKVEWLSREQLDEQIRLSDQRRLGLLPDEPPSDPRQDRKHKVARGERP